MDDQDRDGIFKELSGFLINHRLQWVTEQVDRQIRLGKLVEKEVATLRENEEAIWDSDSSPKKYLKGPKATYPVSQDYNPVERLFLLIDAIEQAVINTSAMEIELMRTFRSENGLLTEIEFFAEETANRTAINWDVSQSRNTAAGKLKELLGLLRSEGPFQ